MRIEIKLTVENETTQRLITLWGNNKKGQPFAKWVEEKLHGSLFAYNPDVKVQVIKVEDNADLL